MALAAAGLVAAGCGGGRESGQSDQRVVVPLVALGDSGLTGTATLVGGEDQTTVSIVVDGAPEVDKTARINSGSSCTFAGGVAAELNDVVGGKSETTLDVALASLADGAHVVEVQAEKTDTPDDPATCGAIPAPPGG